MAVSEFGWDENETLLAHMSCAMSASPEDVSVNVSVSVYVCVCVCVCQHVVCSGGGEGEELTIRVHYVTRGAGLEPGAITQ